MTYTGFTRQTILKWLENGTIKGRKTGNDTSPWIIEAEEMKRVAQKKIDYYESKANKIKKCLSRIPESKDVQ